MSYLSRYKSAGERGLALFTGAIIVENNKTRQTTYLIDDPPQEFLRFQYRCDSKFELEQLEDMLIDNRSYGLFVIDRSEAAYGIAHGTRTMSKNISFPTSWGSIVKEVSPPNDLSD